MTAAQKLTHRLQAIGLTDQQVIDAITAVQEYIKDLVEANAICPDGQGGK